MLTKKIVYAQSQHNDITFRKHPLYPVGYFVFLKQAGLLTHLLHSLSLPVIHSGMFQVALTYSGGNRVGLSPNFPFKL